MEHETRGLDQVPPTLDAPWVVTLTGYRRGRQLLGAVVEDVGVWTGDGIRVTHVTVLGRPRSHEASVEAAAVDDSAATVRSIVRRPPPRLAPGTRDVLSTLDALGLVVALWMVPGTETRAVDVDADADADADDGGLTLHVTVTDVDAAVRAVDQVRALRREGRDRIVLVPSRWSTVEAAAAKDLPSRVPEALLVAFGESVTEHDQLGSGSRSRM